jgi:hypothetical protein
MAIPQTQSNLKSYFNTGDQPTEAQFGELIDTMFYYLGDLQAQIGTLETSIADQPGLASVFLQTTAVATPVTTGYLGAASVVSTATRTLNDVTPGVGNVTMRTLRITFSTPFATTDYTVLAFSNTARPVGSGSPAAVAHPLMPSQVGKNVAYVDIELKSGDALYLLIFHP